MPSGGDRASQPGSAHSQGHGQGEIPERHKAEPSYPMTARQTEEKGWQGEAAAARPAMTARASVGGAHGGGEAVAPQKYDEVSKPNASGGSSVPLTPAAALKLYMNCMTLYEQGEILDYPQVRAPAAPPGPAGRCIRGLAAHPPEMQPCRRGPGQR